MTIQSLAAIYSTRIRYVYVSIPVDWKTNACDETISSATNLTAAREARVSHGYFSWLVWSMGQACVLEKGPTTTFAVHRACFSHKLQNAENNKQQTATTTTMK